MANEQGTGVDMAVALERLRGEFGAGLARIEGALQVLVLRSEHSEKAQAEHQQRIDGHEHRLGAMDVKLTAVEDAVKSHGPRLSSVEKTLWKIGGAIAVVAASAEVVVFLVLHGK